MANFAQDAYIYRAEPGGSGNMSQSITIDWGTVMPFSERSPKPDTIKAVKLTEDNLRAVGGYIFQTTGQRVELADDSVGGLRVGSSLSVDRYRAGDWLVEDYDYIARETFFRLANLGERQKFDLR